MLRTLYLAVALVAGSAHANVMTFESLTGKPASYTEDGITAVGGSHDYPDIRVSTHIDRGIAFEPVWLDFTMGELFQPVSFDVLALGSGYCATSTDFNCDTRDGDPIPYIWASGYRNDVLVSTFGIYRARTLEDWETISLSMLGSIDRLRIEAKNFLDLGLPGWCSHQLGCGHFSIDNFTAKPVPEPATLSLLAIGILGALGARRRISSRPAP